MKVTIVRTIEMVIPVEDVEAHVVVAEVAEDHVAVWAVVAEAE